MNMYLFFLQLQTFASIFFPYFSYPSEQVRIGNVVMGTEYLTTSFPGSIYLLVNRTEFGNLNVFTLLYTRFPPILLYARYSVKKLRSNKIFKFVLTNFHLNQLRQIHIILYIRSTKYITKSITICWSVKLGKYVDDKLRVQ